MYYILLHISKQKLFFWNERKKADGRVPVRFLCCFQAVYLMLPRSLTVMDTEGMAEMSLETVILPSNISFTRAL